MNPPDLRRHLTLATPDEGTAVGREPVANSAFLHAQIRSSSAAASTPAAPSLTATPSLTAANGALESSGLLQVGDLAKATGKTVRAIHLYEDLGLIEATRRSPGRYRLFSPDAKVRVRWISKLQSLGLSLTEIQAIVQRRQSSESARRAAQELRQVYGEKLADVREKLREYLALEQELEASVTFLDGCQQSCSAGVHVPGCSSCSRRMEPVAALPDLVVGAQLGGPN